MKKHGILRVTTPSMDEWRAECDAVRAILTSSPLERETKKGEKNEITYKEKV